MTKEHALKILINFNNWRQGDDTFEQPHPKVLTQAMNIAIEALQEDIKNDKT